MDKSARVCLNYKKGTTDQEKCGPTRKFDCQEINLFIVTKNSSGRLIPLQFNVV